MNKIFSWRMAVIACALFAIPAALLATHSWGGYHWARTTSQFTLKLGDNLTSGIGSPISAKLRSTGTVRRSLARHRHHF